jgi:hypothetical protein
MRNGLAEWVLSIVAGRDRASVIVGDLLESECGKIPFRVLLTTAMSIAVHHPHPLLAGMFSISISLFSLWFLMHAIGMSFLMALLVALPSEIVAYGILRSRRRSPNQSPRQRSS